MPRRGEGVSRLESGWIARLARDPELAEGIEEAHTAYASERGRMASGAERWGGVGGTGHGLKCLHAHYAYHLAGGDDAVGAWTAARMEPVHAPELGGGSRRSTRGRIPHGSSCYSLATATRSRSAATWSSRG